MSRIVGAAAMVAVCAAMAAPVAASAAVAAPAPASASASADDWAGYYNSIEACVAAGEYAVRHNRATNYQCVYEAFPYGQYHLWLDQLV